MDDDFMKIVHLRQNLEKVNLVPLGKVGAAYINNKKYSLYSNLLGWSGVDSM